VKLFERFGGKALKLCLKLRLVFHTVYHITTCKYNIFVALFSTSPIDISSMLVGRNDNIRFVLPYIVLVIVLVGYYQYDCSVDLFCGMF